uniref:MFS-type transporter SLC18B1 n=1 Tax=Cacopsylla melanoneura TaxID=428564 RepID=A0A8D8SSK7_9HEMI
MLSSTFTKRQWLTLIVFSIADFCNAICVSLQAPFYPHEAEKKGATPTEYGFVFGVFELVVFLISPFYGQHLNRIGPKYLFNGGIFTTGICAILFGCLHFVDGHYPFIILSFVIRIVEAMGNAAFLTASFAIIAMEFPDNVATTFASLETFFGLGLIVGPTVGGALYQWGNFMTPFVVLGFLLFLSALMTMFVLPDHQPREPDESTGGKLIQALKIPGVFLSAASIVVTSMSIGFLQATLEPHLRQFELSPMVLGLMFVINGGTYALMAPCWGWLCDRYLHPKVVTVIGCVLLAAGFSLIGPAPFVPSETVLWLTIVGLVIHGLGIAAQLVASFTDALRTTIQYGFPNNLETYGLISGLWTSTFAFGAFVGPSVAGVLYELTGFRNATIFIIVCSLLVGVFVAIFLIVTKSSGKYREVPSEAEPIINRHLEPAAGGGGSTAHSTFNISSAKLFGSSTSLNLDRPPGMSGIIPCSSYKNRLGTWNRKESEYIFSGQSASYGSTLENSLQHHHSQHHAW